jgi:hypothetical protein
LYETYQTDLTCNLDEFKREIARWRTRWSITPRDQMPTSLCETHDAVNPVLYPSIDTILCIMLTMPVTSATAERPFLQCKQPNLEKGGDLVGFAPQNFFG